MLDLMPGFSAKQRQDMDIEKAEKEFSHMEAIILSMTPQERDNPKILNSSRRKRISAGCGLPVSEINSLIRKYEDTKKMMKQFTGGKFRKKGAFRGLF